MNLDQFYTLPKVAKSCWNDVKRKTQKLVNWDSVIFIEPSAGKGAFYSLMPKDRRIGFDLEPKYEGVLKIDFMEIGMDITESVITLGNPPFGKRGKLALQFFNRSSRYSDIIAFIVPYTFTRWEIHSKIPKDWRLIHERNLATKSFILDNNKYFEVGAVFQIWTNIKSRHKDLRILSAPSIKHPDFIIMQYNNTKQARKLFKEDFDFGVPCQGWQDYNRRETNEKNMEREKQWILFKAKNKSVLSKLKKINFHDLAHENVTNVPGFRKADVVSKYEEIQ